MDSVHYTGEHYKHSGNRGQDLRQYLAVARTRILPSETKLLLGRQSSIQSLRSALFCAVQPKGTFPALGNHLWSVFVLLGRPKYRHSGKDEINTAVRAAVLFRRLLLLAWSLFRCFRFHTQVRRLSHCLWTNQSCATLPFACGQTSIMAAALNSMCSY